MDNGSTLMGNISKAFFPLSKIPTMVYTKRCKVEVDMSSKELNKIRPDAKGRIFLGKLAEGVSSYTVIKDHGRIILEPNVEIPAKEKWLWDNKTALKQVQKGIEDSGAGKTKSRGDFLQFVDDDEE